MTICVLGLGNTLLKDDGAGVRVAEALQELELPPDVRVLDTGTAILRMLPELTRADRIIVVDAVRAGGQPGDIYAFDDPRAPVPIVGSVHDVQFEDVLEQLRLLGCSPTVQYYGIEPKEIAFSLDLSPEVAMSVPLLVRHIHAELQHPATIQIS